MHISTKCSIAIHCLIFINEYGANKKVTSELLALSTGSNPVTIRNIMSALKKEGILNVKHGTGGTEICSPLEEITLYRVYQAIEPEAFKKLIGIHGKPSPFCPVGRNIHAVLDGTYQKIQEDLGHSLQQITMADVVENYHNLKKEI